MNCIAHRGFADAHPENTLAAVSGAVAAGADGIELDVRRCGSGELVVVHDATLERIADREVAVSALSHTELAAVSVLGSDEGVPTLADVCRAVPPSVRLNLELKEGGLAADAVAIAREHDCDVLVSSFVVSHLLEVPRTDGIPDVPIALIFYAAPARARQAAIRIGCSAVHPSVSLCTDDFVASAHEAGLAVNAWTVTARAEAETLAERGVDGVIADAPAYCPESPAAGVDKD